MQLRLPAGVSSTRAREEAFDNFGGAVIKLCHGLEGERPWSDELRVTQRCHLNKERGVLIAQLCLVGDEDIALLASKISDRRLQLPEPLRCAVSAVWDGAVGETAVRVIDVPHWATASRIRARLERGGYRVLSAVPERDESGFARASAVLLRLDIAADGPRPPSELRFGDQPCPSRCDIITDIPVMPVPASSAPAAQPSQPAQGDAAAAAASSPAAGATASAAAPYTASGSASCRPGPASPSSPAAHTAAPVPLRSAAPPPQQPSPQTQLALPPPPPLPPPPSGGAVVVAAASQQQRQQPPPQQGSVMQLRRRRPSQLPQDQQLLATDGDGSLQLARQPAPKRSKSPPTPPTLPQKKLRPGDARGGGNPFAPLASLPSET